MLRSDTTSSGRFKLSDPEEIGSKSTVGSRWMFSFAANFPIGPLNACGLIVVSSKCKKTALKGNSF